MVGVGFALVYLGFGYGLASLYVAVTRAGASGAPPRRPVADAAVASTAAAAVAALFAPAIDGFPQGVLDGWEGLDPFSTVTAALLALGLVGYAARSGAGGALRRPIAASMAGSLAALLVGNTVIQTFTTRGTEPRWGLFVAAGCSLACLAAAALTMRGGPTGPDYGRAECSSRP